MMSPSLALESEIFLRYLTFVGGLLLVAGLVLLLMTYVLKKNASGIWRTYRGWWIMAPLAFGAVFAGREATIIGIGLLAFAGFKEFVRATGLYQDW